MKHEITPLEVFARLHKIAPREVPTPPELIDLEMAEQAATETACLAATLAATLAASRRQAAQATLLAAELAMRDADAHAEPVSPLSDYVVAVMRARDAVTRACAAEDLAREVVRSFDEGAGPLL